MTHTFGDRPGWNTMFRQGELTLGLMYPLESYSGAVPRLDVAEQVEQSVLADQRGFAALWARDVPLLDLSFGDGGQLFDTWVWLATIAARTTRIALATGSTVLPLRNPIDVAKAAASLDQLSGGRLVIGAATGDRGVEFPAYGLNRDHSGVLFRESVEVIRRLWAEDFPDVDSVYGTLRGTDLLPKPLGRRVPLLITGNSRQEISWIAEHGDGWLMYPRPLVQQRMITTSWQQATPRWKPFAQSLYIDIEEDAGAAPKPIHLGFRSGWRHLLDHLGQLRDIGVNHVALNLKYGRRPAPEVLQEIAENVLPHFPTVYPEPAEVH
ncbi:LLM class oxidoreductase [Actinokineospora diospyrosa]|uniref:Luciferase-type oxidoreductase, BA3436 family n=1 Tax=Actinokineospora diospyrosa TaxID=103728 RepID=A0ABT1I5L0_9PSEU|nr:LLM class oxidoreductase [Actinokineospora diospyrosa]MCP2267859.1 luciferase-type oxidoreductase, BA3436 family [Actinokineospora diospyrosa]